MYLFLINLCYYFNIYYTSGFPRTNNQNEGWHNKLARAMGTVQPNVFKFVTGLLEEQKETEHIFSRIEAGHEPAARRPVYVAHDQRLIKIVQKFEREIFDDSYTPYLKAIAHNLSL